jgi:hypothetical protein
MVRTGVRSTLRKHGYRCSFDRDKEFLTSCLELLVLLKRLLVDIIDFRRIAQLLTWYSPTTSLVMVTLNGDLVIYRDKGTLLLGDDVYSFTPVPTWVSCLLSCPLFTLD